MNTQTLPRIGDRVRVVSVETDAMRGYVGRVGTVEDPLQMPNGYQDCVSVRFDKAKRFKAVSAFFKVEHLTTDIDTAIPAGLPAGEIQEINGGGSECSCSQCLTPLPEVVGPHLPVTDWESAPPSSSRSTLTHSKFSEATGPTSQFTGISEPTIPSQENMISTGFRFPALELAMPEIEQDSTTQNRSYGENHSDVSASENPGLLLWNSLKGLSNEDFAQSLGHYEWQAIRDGISSSYRQRKSEQCISETGFLSCPTLTSCSSKSSRPAGTTKCERWWRNNGLVPNGSQLSAKAIALMMGFPEDWFQVLSLSPVIPQAESALDTLPVELSHRLKLPLLSEEFSTSIPSPCEIFPDGSPTNDKGITVPAEVEYPPKLQACENFPKSTLGKNWIDPREIDLYAGTQSRYVTDWETVQRYTEQMAEGFWDWERQPLPVIFQDPEGRKYPGDAHHRTTAAVAAKIELICVDLRLGSLLDAIMFSCQSLANREHGLPLTAKDQRRRIELFLDTRDRLPESDERRRYSSREIGRYLGLSESGYRTIVNIITEREMLGKISQFASGDRVQVVRNPAAGSGGYWPEGTLGKVQGIDKKKGILVVPDTAAHLDRWMLSHGWIHPDNLIKSDAPWLSGKISQDEESGRQESPGTDSGSTLPPQSLVREPKSRDKQLLPDVNRNGDVPPTAEIPVPAALVNQTTITNGKPDVVAAEIAIGIKHLNPEGLLHVIEAIAHHIGAEIFGDLVVESIYKDEVADLCNKCLGAMDKRAFSWMEVEKINFTGLSDSALKLLVKESKRSLNERHHLEYFNKPVVDRSHTRRRKDAPKAPLVDWHEDTEDEELKLGVPNEDDQEVLQWAGG